MFRCYSYTIIRERINLWLLKLQLLPQSIKIHRCVVNTVVVWLHILGPYWCLYIVLLSSDMFWCYSYTIIRERINLCLLKLQLLKQSIKIHRCVVNTVAVWLHILGPYWCLYVALFGSSKGLPLFLHCYTTTQQVQSSLIQWQLLQNNRHIKKKSMT